MSHRKDCVASDFNDLKALNSTNTGISITFISYRMRSELKKSEDDGMIAERKLLGRLNVDAISITRFFVLLAILFPLAVTSYSQEPTADGMAQQCQVEPSPLTEVESHLALQSWAEWFEKTTGSTAFESINKNSQWKFSQGQLEVVYRDPTGFPLAEDSKIGRNVTESLSVPSLKMAQGPNERDQGIVDRSIAAINERKDDELIVIFVGEVHATDLYMQAGKRDDTTYVSYPKDSHTFTESQGLLDLFAELGISENRKKVDDDSAVSQAGIAARLYYYDKAHGKRVAWTEFESQDSQSSPGVIVIQDYHAIDVNPEFQVIPDENTLRSLDFNRVTVYMEGFPAGEVSNEDLETKYDFGKTYQKVRPQQTKSIRRTSPEAWEMMNSGTAIQYPEMKDLHDRLKAYERSGIKVGLRGLE